MHQAFPFLVIVLCEQFLSHLIQSFCYRLLAGNLQAYKVLISVLNTYLSKELNITFILQTLTSLLTGYCYFFVWCLVFLVLFDFQLDMNLVFVHTHCNPYKFFEISAQGTQIYVMRMELVLLFWYFLLLKIMIQFWLLWN